VEVSFPIPWHLSGGTGNRLALWVVFGRGERRPFVELLRRVVPEPILSRLEATDDAVLRALCMRRGMLARRGVAASDVAALRAAPEMEPPAPGFEAFDASGSTRGDGWIDSFVCHWLLLCLEVDRRCARMVVEWRLLTGIA
jgi:hypothetical protein